MIYITTIAIVAVLTLGFTTFNMLRKNEKQEDILASYLLYLDRVSRVIELSDTRLKEIDAKGTFKSDDEVGFFFDQITQIQDILNELQVKEVEINTDENLPK